MTNLYSYSSLHQFFSEIYHILREVDKNLVEIWCEIPNIPFIKNFSKYDLLDFIEKFKFISIKKGNYIHYIVINKVSFIIDCINILKFDIKRLSEILDYNGFETLVKEILSRNNYHSTINFRFSDKSGSKSDKIKKNYEIDVIGISARYILVIDAKQWKHRDTYSALNKAANKQYQRMVVLKKNPLVFRKLIIKILGKPPNLLNRSPFILIPTMVTLEDNNIKLNDNQVPLVSIYELNAFLLELPKNLHYFKTIQIENKELFF
ncbi:MAG: hypothetical protein ACFFCC_16715 [Promethearchaeota archaeon]